jgi:glycosyltransferase involved in cell wall biosynthesis
MKNNSIRTLFITKETPYPANGGVGLRTLQNINIMKKFGPVGIFSVFGWEAKVIPVPGAEFWKHCNVAQQRSNWEKFNTRLWWFHPRRHSESDWIYSKTAAQELDKLLTEFQPDLVVMEEIWLYPYLKVVQRHKCHIIFDNLNIEASLWQQTHEKVQGFKAKLKAKVQLDHIKSMEKDFATQANQVWVCSQDDASLLQQFYGQVAPTHVIFNGINIKNYDCVRFGECTPPVELPDKKRSILFMGQLSYSPNTVAAELLINQIYPRLKQIHPDSHLLLVGRKPTQFMLEAAKREPGIIVTGSVPEVHPYLAAASIMVVPLLQGGGTRLKIVEAFAAGCPVISTAKGAEGIKAVDGEHLLIRNEVEEIVEGICQLWSNPSFADTLAHSAYELVQAEYSWEAVGRKVELAIQKLFG